MTNNDMTAAERDQQIETEHHTALRARGHDPDDYTPEALLVSRIRWMTAGRPPR